MDSEDEHSPSTLRHSEVASVESPVGPHVPEFFHATEECSHVPAAMRGEKSRYVLEEDEGRSVPLHKVEEGEGEAASGSGSHASSLSGNGEVLAGEAARPEGCVSPIRFAFQPCGIPLRGRTLNATAGVFVAELNSEWPCCQSNDVTEVRDSRPSLGKGGGGVWVDLG